MIEILKADQAQTRELFLSLPPRLYPKKLLVQNRAEEAELLCSTHVLSKYFSFTGFVAVRGGSAVARCAVTLYPDSEDAYFGFFESVDETACASAVLKAAEQFACALGRKRMIGPVDASFWIRYRLKVGGFSGRPYVSEPYQNPYYLNLLQESGYAVAVEYISNRYAKLPRRDYQIQKYQSRYQEFIAQGYEIRSPKRSEWDTVIREVYRLVIALYSDFPVFSYLTEEDFCKLFASYKMILDLSMVKIAYYQGEAVGFFIGMPDYQNRLYGKITPLTLLYVLCKRIRSRRYVMLYLGVDPRHRGLGKAITQSIIENVHKKRAESIGAFIRRGKITEDYVKEQKQGIYEYVLLEKALEENDENHSSAVG